ncbi:unnamed protein product [Sphagnum balticum]
MLKTAHILPDSTKKSILNLLQLKPEFRNDVEAEKWNFMILRSDVEEAFDALKISFIADVVHPNSFCLHVWDPADLKPDVIEASGKELTIPEGIKLSRRALSYQALMAYLSLKYQDSSIELTEPWDFSSEFEGKDQKRKALAGLFQTSLREELDEENEEEADS